MDITREKLPEIVDVADGTVVEIVDADGIFWGRFKACRNWCGERFWMDWPAGS
jgi:hypothetical protein